VRVGELLGSISVLPNKAGVSFDGRGTNLGMTHELETWDRILAIATPTPLRVAHGGLDEVRSLEFYLSR